MKEILLTNDDGFDAPGLLALANALKSLGNVTIVAPAAQKSACSHSLTLTRPLRFVRVGDGFFKLEDATTADCVYLALETLFPNRPPDLLISGINHGANMGEDVTYSGTCGGAMEGTLHGVPSIAASLYYEGDSVERYGYDLAAEITANLAKKVLENGFPIGEREFLNLNIPAVPKAFYKGLAVAPAGKRVYTTKAQLGRDPRGNEYYWLGEASVDCLSAPDENCDLNLVFGGFACLTPIKLDMSARDSLRGLADWLHRSGK